MLHAKMLADFIPQHLNPMLHSSKFFSGSFFKSLFLVIHDWLPLAYLRQGLTVKKGAGGPPLSQGCTLSSPCYKPVMLFEINHSVQLALIELNNGNRRFKFYIMGWDINHCGWLAHP